MAHETTLWGVFGIVAVGLAGAGCQTTSTLKAITAGYAPCRADDITITDEHLSSGFSHGFAEWDATCWSEQWHCAGAGALINCRRVELSAPSANATPAQNTSEPSTPEPQAPKSKWITYESDACGVSARFPQEPAISSNEPAVTAGVTLLEQAVYDKPDGSGTMGFTCASIPKANANEARMLDGARNGLVANTKGKLVSERPIIGGREVHFRTENRDGLARIFIAGNKILVALVHPLDAFPEKSTRRFFDSVQSL